jgi:hypothetical protein
MRGRLSAGGNRLPVDGRKEAMCLELIDAWALGRVYVQHLQKTRRERVSTKTDRGERSEPVLTMPARRRRLPRRAQNGYSDTRRGARMETVGGQKA